MFFFTMLLVGFFSIIGMIWIFISFIITKSEISGAFSAICLFTFVYVICLINYTTKRSSKMSENFTDEGNECLKIKGNPSNMIYLLRKGSLNPLGSTQLLYGSLVQIGSQLFTDLAPQIGLGSHVLIRQKTNANDIIAVDVKTSEGHIKNKDWHYQPNNKDPFYYTSFLIDTIPMELAIGSNVGLPKLIEFFDNINHRVVRKTDGRVLDIN